MAKEPKKKITVPEGSDLAKLLTEATARPILLEKNGELFRLERIEKEVKMPSLEEVTRSREGILKAAGSWKDIDTDKLIADIYRAREEGVQAKHQTIMAYILALLGLQEYGGAGTTSECAIIPVGQNHLPYTYF